MRKRWRRPPSSLFGQPLVEEEEEEKKEKEEEEEGRGVGGWVVCPSPPQYGSRAGGPMRGQGARTPTSNRAGRTQTGRLS